MSYHYIILVIGYMNECSTLIPNKVIATVRLSTPQGEKSTPQGVKSTGYVSCHHSIQL